MQPPLYSIKDFAAKIKDKYPEYKNVDDNTLVQKITEKYPSYKRQLDPSELQQFDKKKVSSGGSNDFSGFTSTNQKVGGNASADVSVGVDSKDPVKSYLTPFRVEHQVATNAFNPLRNRSVSDQTQLNNIPVDVRNKMFEESDFGVKQKNEKAANINLQKAQVEVHRQLSNVQNAKNVLEDVKKKNGGVIPEDNETAAIAKKTSDDFDVANKDNALVKMAANSSNIKDFVKKYSATPITNDKELEEKTVDAMNDPNVEEAFRLSGKAGLYAREASNFNNLFPLRAKQKISSELAQWMDESNKGGGLVSSGYSKKDLDAQIEKQYKLGKINAVDRAFYYQNIKPSDVPTTADLNTFGRDYQYQMRNSFLGRALAGVGLLENPKEKYKYQATVDPKRTAGKAFGLVGQVAPMMLETMALGGAGFSGKAANVISVIDQFAPHNQDRAEELYPNDPAKKWAYTLAGTGIDLLTGELPIFKSAIFKKEAENFANIVADKTINSSVKEQAKRTFLNKIEGFVKEAAKNTAHGSAILTTIPTFHKLLDIAGNAPSAVQNLKNTDFVGEFLNNVKSYSLLGLAQAGGKLLPEQKQQAEQQLQQSQPYTRIFDELPFEQKVINAIKQEGKLSPFMQEHLDKSPDAIIEELKDQVKQGMEGGAKNHTGATELMYGKTAVDLVEKQIKNEQSGNTTSTTPTTEQNRAEVRDTENEQAGVNTTDNGLQDGNSGSGKDVGGEKVADKVYVHETDAPPFDKFDMSKVGSGQGEQWLGRGIYLQEKGAFKFETYGKNKVEATLSPDAKIFEIKETPNGKYRDNFVEWAVENTEVGKRKAQQRIDEGLSLDNLLPRDILKNNPEAVEKLKEQGYDGLNQDGELVIYNPDVLSVKKTTNEIPISTDKNKKEDVGGEKVDGDVYGGVYKDRKEVSVNGDKYFLAQLNENNHDRTFVIEDGSGAEIGKATLSADGNYLENIRIDEAHRRKGLASKLYDYIESRKGIELQSSPVKQSKEAVKLWEKRNLQKSVSKNANGGLLAKALNDAIRQTFGDAALKKTETNEIPISTEEKSNTIKEANTVEQGAGEVDAEKEKLQKEHLTERMFVARWEKEKADAKEYLDKYKDNPFADKVGYNKKKLANAEKNIKEHKAKLKEIEDKLNPKVEEEKPSITLIKDFGKNVYVEYRDGSREIILKEKYENIISSEVGNRNNQGEVIEKDSQPKETPQSTESIIPTNEGQPPSKEPPVEGIGEVRGENVSGITHADTAETRKELGLPEYEGLPSKGRTNDSLIEDAKQKIAGNPNIANEVMDKYKAGGKMTPEDNAILSEYKAALDYQLEKTPSKETFDKVNELIKVLEPAGSEAGELLQSRKLLSAQEDNLSNFLLDKQEAQGAPLSEKQFKDETAKYEELKKANEELKKQLQEEKEKYNKLAAEKGINQAKAEAKKASKKSRDEYVAERKKIVEDIKNKWKNVGKGGELHIDLPFRQQLTEIAPDVKKYVQSLIEEGVDKLDDIATAIYTDLKDVIDGIKKSDIVDIMAGEHDAPPKEQTKNQKANAIRLLQREAKLLNELKKIRKGEENAKSETERVEKTRRIQELEGKIKEVREQNKKNNIDEAPDDKAIGEGELNDAFEKKLLAKAKKLQEDIKNRNFLKEKPQPPVFQKSRKAQILEDRVIDLENKIRHERSIDEYNKRGKLKKAFDFVMETVGIRRLVQAAVDISVPFRQGATLLSPRQIDVWGKGFMANIRSVFNPKRFDRIMYGIRHDPMYHDMIKDRVVFNDLGSADPNLHNEDFRKSWIYKIPILSEPLKASNRSADAFLNVARYEMYKKLRARLEQQGLTRESDPMAFKYIGNWVMSMTGRGRMTNMLENSVAHTVLGNTFFGARLMASRFNILNPVTYFDPRVPKQAKMEAMKDIASWTVTTMAIGAGLAATTGAKISLNPDDSDFLQLRFGNKVYDISGGLATYIRTFLRMGKAGYIKATGTKYQGKKATDNAGQSVLNFFRNKLSPNTAYATDAFFGKAYGRQFDPYDIVKIYPMYGDDAYKALKEDGIISLATVLLPNLVGIGYGSYASKGQIDATVDELFKRNLRSDEMNNEKIKNYKEGGRPVTFDEFNKFADRRDEEIKTDLQKLYDNGIDGIKYKDLTPDQLADEIAYIKSHATTKVKEELFGKTKKTSIEKSEDNRLQKARQKLYK